MTASALPSLRREVSLALYEAGTENRSIEAEIALHVTGTALAERFRRVSVSTPDGEFSGREFIERLFALTS